MSENGSGAGSISFSITSSDDPAKPHRFTLGPEDQPIKIGRYKKNSLTLSNTGVSWVHLELKQVGLGLVARDLSSNGVGLKAPYHDEPVRIEKGVDVEVEHGSLLVLPFKVSRKEKHADSPQTTLTIEVDGCEVKKSGPVLVTVLGEAPVGGLGAPGQALLASTREAEGGDTLDLRSESPQSHRSRSRSRGKEVRKSESLQESSANGVAGEADESKQEQAGAKKKDKKKLGPGSVVRVKGLQARGELNGKIGTIIEFDQAGGFWKVRMEDGTGKAFKPANLTLAPQKERLDRCRALLHDREDDQSDLAQLCREVMDESKPPPPPDELNEEAPPPPPSAAPQGLEAAAPPPPPETAQAPLPPPSGPPVSLPPAGHLAPQGPLGMDMATAMGMQAMMPVMPQMAMGMPTMMPQSMGLPIPGVGLAAPPPPLAMPMGYPSMGVAMPMMGMAMPGMQQPPPPAYPPPM
jgi:hypothetical protein